MEVLRIGNYLPNEFLADTNNYIYNKNFYRGDICSFFSFDLLIY